MTHKTEVLHQDEDHVEVHYYGDIFYSFGRIKRNLCEATDMEDE